MKWQSILSLNFSDPPHPQQLTLEKQLNRSILISWQPPEGLEASAVDAYHVYLDGKLKNTIKGSERTKALLEDVESSQVSYYCVILRKKDISSSKLLLTYTEPRKALAQVSYF